MSDGMAATAVRHRRGRQCAVHSGSGGNIKKVTINRKCGCEWWRGGTAMRHCRSRKWAAPSGSGGKKGNNQPEVWQREWWGNCHATLLWRGRQGAAAAKRRKKVTINWRCGCMSDGMAATAMQHRRGRPWAVQSGSGSNIKRGNNQPEVQLREWWRGGHCRATSSQQAGGSAKWKCRQKMVTINQRCSCVSGGSVCHATLSRQAGGSAKWKWRQKKEKR